MSHVFRGRTLTEAQKAAERELGGDVVVLDKRKVKQKGVAGLLGGTEFEITAGVAVTEDIEQDVHLSLRATAPAKKKLFASGAYDDSLAPGSRSSAREMAKLNAEVRAMRGMIHALSRSPNRITAEIATLRRAVDGIVPTSASSKLEMLITRSGLEGPLAAEIRRELSEHQDEEDSDDAESLVDAYRDALADRISVRSWPLSSDTRKVIAVVGPPGVGKTTTAAKLAARALADGKSVSFITCDTYRVGAVEQLERYAKLLATPIDVAKTPDEMVDAIRASTADIVIIDTSGRGPLDDESVEAALAQGTKWGDRSRHVLLCMDAATRYADAERLQARFRLCGATSIAVTKMDLTAAPAGLLNGTLHTDLPVSVLCDGQRVPEDISPATAGRILDHIAPHRWANSSRFQN